ncbi:MAG TPA: hypothetical protein VKK79_15985 [Candidatus Lokiarchaeia archaeon]|nr:hypothetical protein [Candidatus Lokiarchaeia archaeon]
MDTPLEPPANVPSDPFLDVIREYNALMRDNTTGPNCVDPTQCRGDCCSIMIDIPRVLAELYVEQGWLSPGNLRRGGPFAFRLGVSARTAKCVFFDHDLNGCRAHFTCFKPPQCWIYPTGFDAGVKTCKKGYEWDIVDPAAAREAEILLEKYKTLSLEEVEGEVPLLKASWVKIEQTLRATLGNLPPRKFVGMTWGYTGLGVADAEGISLQARSACLQTVPDCPQDFIECERMCPAVIEWVLEQYAPKLDLFFQNEECGELLQLRDLK